MRRLSLAIVGFAVFAALLASVAGGASGDPPTIAFYKQVQASYKSVPAVRVQRRGFLWYTDKVKGSLVRWVNGKKPPAGAGYRPATESIIMLLTNGVVTKYVDTAKAPGLPPLTLIEDSTGFWVALNTKTGGCYNASKRSADVAGWHSPFVGVYGTFAPMTTQGNTVVVTSTYPWLDGRARDGDRPDLRDDQAPRLVFGQGHRQLADHVHGDEHGHSRAVVRARLKASLLERLEIVLV